MGPGMLGRIYAPDDIRSSTQDVVKKQGGTFIIGKAVRADRKGKQLILEYGETAPFDPGGDYLLIFNMGDGTGVLRKKWLTFDGRLAFKIKDYIDRRFMNKFQIME
jgi:NADH dehydrogenase FAD-containing subunit